MVREGKQGKFALFKCLQSCPMEKNYVCCVWPWKELQMGGNLTGWKPPGGRIKLTIRKHFLIGVLLLCIRHFTKYFTLIAPLNT